MAFRVRGYSQLSLEDLCAKVSALRTNAWSVNCSSRVKEELSEICELCLHDRRMSCTVDDTNTVRWQRYHLLEHLLESAVALDKIKIFVKLVHLEECRFQQIKKALSDRVDRRAETLDALEVW